MKKHVLIGVLFAGLCSQACARKDETPLPTSIGSAQASPTPAVAKESLAERAVKRLPAPLFGHCEKWEDDSMACDGNGAQWIHVIAKPGAAPEIKVVLDWSKPPPAPAAPQAPAPAPTPPTKTGK